MVRPVPATTATTSPETANPIRWIRKNLFNTWYNSLLTVAAVAALAALAPRLARWAWHADWAVVSANMTLLLTGTYPRDQLWRLWAALLTVMSLFGLSAGAWRGNPRRWIGAAAVAAMLATTGPFQAPARGWLLGTCAGVAAGFMLGRGLTAWRRALWRRVLVALWVVSVPWIYLLLHGWAGSSWLPRVGPSAWGGLTLTLVLAIVGIVASFPLGILLALGRRSRLPAIRWVCTAYIECVRGVPLISILFMAQVLLPIFLPDYRIEHVVRAMVGITLFSAAYMAENVRGGLQGVPRGQIEAAHALGLNGIQTLALIVLPQALRAVLPAIVGQFISLLKDTSLVAVVGLLELLGIARSVLANPTWLGRQAEVYLFVAMVYFIFSFSMSSASRRLERALGLGER
ncbi:MAG: amino acid ABC transporter permease [Firmicutes bacterium ZCTH02-B6]|nr:MAG: amino acid ABC transporter permease [Firmicutes bacterium ZCTH02-B6]